MANEDIEQKIKLTYETNANDVAKNVNKLDDAVEKTTESQKESTKANKSQTESLENLGGGIGSAIKGFKGLIKQMWALVANPIGAVIAAIALALVALYKAFTSTNAGADKMEQIMAGISATLDVLRDRVLKVGNAIKKFFSGDFKGAIEEGKAAVSGFGAEVAREFKQAADAAKELQEVADAMRELGVSRAKLNRDLVKAKEIIEDENSSYRDKKKAIEDVTKAETEQTNKELLNAKRKYEAIKLANSLSDTSDEDLQKEADAEKSLYEIQEQSSRDKIKNIKLLERAKREEQARLKEISDAEKQRYKEDYDAEAAAIKARNDLKAQLAKEDLDRQKAGQAALNEYEDEQYQLELDREDAKIQAAYEASLKRQEIAKNELEQKKAIKEAEEGLLFSGLNALKNIFGKNKKIQKGILIAENAAALSKITMNTVEAVSKDNASSPLTLGMPWSGIHIAQGAIGAANVIASTARGLKELGGGSAGSVPNISAASGASATPQTGFQASSENQIATTIATNTNTQPPIEAYIVESSVTTAQSLARKKIESNSI